MPKIILAAGMRRSGSTWLYNVLRYSFMNAGYRTYGDYLDRYEADAQGDIHVLKIHPFDQDYCHRAANIFTTCRDIRDVVASMVRRNLVDNNPVAVADCAMEIINVDYTPWQKVSNLEIRYEEMINNKPAMIASILDVLQLSHVDPEEVHADVEKLTRIVVPTRDRTTQLWPNHFTDGGVGSYDRTLSQKTIEAVEQVAHGWLEHHGYIGR